MENKQLLATILSYDKIKGPPMLNKAVPDNQRVLVLSPTVRAGFERECTKEDFEKEGRGLIGKGGFGEVWKVMHRQTKKIYCIKIVAKQGIIEQKLQNQMNREIEIMYALNHPHCLRLKNHFEDNDNFYLVMPLAVKGQLYKALKNQKRFDEKTTAQYLRETISALKYLHSFNPPIIHRDLKPENLLLTENNRILLADFGWSNFTSDSEAEKRKTFCGTPEYIAPEMLKKEGHDHRVDVWSVGVLMFELLAGYSPFVAKTNQDLYQNIRRLKIKWPSDMPPLAKNLISKILKLVPQERLTFDQIIDHEWFKRTPEIRPPLVNEFNNDRDLMFYHFISTLTPEIEAQIKESIKVASGTSLYTPTSSTSNLSSAPEPEDKRKSIIQELKEKNSKTPDSISINMNKEENDKLVYLNSKLTQENQGLKMKLVNNESELKNLKTELVKYKEVNTAALQDKVKKLNEQIEVLRIGEKDRLEALSDLEEKNKIILNLNSKLQIMEGEKAQTDKEFEALKNQIKDLTKQLDLKEISIEQLGKKNSILNQEKEDLFLDYQKKMELLQIKVFQTASSGQESSSSKVIEILNESVDEFKNIFKRKMDSFIENFTQFKQEYTKRDEKLTTLIKDKSTIINDILQKNSTKLASDIQRTFENASKTSSSTKDQQMEWLKKQIQELTPYRSRVNEAERKVTEMTSKLNFYQEMEALKLKTTSQETKGSELKTNRVENLIEKHNMLKYLVYDFFKSIESLIAHDEDKKKKMSKIKEHLEVSVDHI